MKTFTIIKATGMLFAVSMLVSGCGKPGNLEQAYSFSEREEMLVTADSGSYAPLFAADLCVPTNSVQEEDTSITAEAGGLFDLSDKTVRYSKNLFEKLYPASTTKVMTALLVLEEGTLSDTVTVTEDAVITEAGASLCGIKPGDQLTLEQLLYGLLIPSGNDAANAIAVHMSGSVAAFTEKMNERALELGATQTHFMNPSGLSDENHYTTAYDLYLIFNEAMKYPLFREVIGTSGYTAAYADGDGKPVEKTWNVGNWYQKGDREAPEGVTVLGGKTGTTQAAGYCLIMASKDEQDQEYISVVLKAGNRPALYDNMSNIIAKIVN